MAHAYGLNVHNVTKIACDADRLTNKRANSDFVSLDFKGSGDNEGKQQEFAVNFFMPPGDEEYARRIKQAIDDINKEFGK